MSYKQDWSRVQNHKQYRNEIDRIFNKTMKWQDAQKIALERLAEMNLPENLRGEVVCIPDAPITNTNERMINQALSRMIRKRGAKVVYQNFQ